MWYCKNMAQAAFGGNWKTEPEVIPLVLHGQQTFRLRRRVSQYKGIPLQSPPAQRLCRDWGPWRWSGSSGTVAWEKPEFGQVPLTSPETLLHWNTVLLSVTSQTQGLQLFYPAHFSFKSVSAWASPELPNTQSHAQPICSLH